MGIKETMLYCELEKSEQHTYIPDKIEYSSIYIPDRGLAHKLAFIGEDSSEVQRIKDQIKEYNKYLTLLGEQDGFWRTFAEYGYMMSYAEVENTYGVDFAECVFSLKSYVFETDLCIADEVLFSKSHEPKYKANLPDGEVVEFIVGSYDDGYPCELSDGRRLLWNWMSKDKDFTYFLWKEFDHLGWLPEEKNYDDFECWDQARHCCEEADPNLMRCLCILIGMGYVKKYELKAEAYSPWFKLRGYDDGKIGLCVLDASFSKNKLLSEKIRMALCASKDDVLRKKYFLTDRRNNQYLSDEPGQIGGHHKLKIYGKLECGSARQHIQNGKYVQHRVFFVDEDTAKAARYRPCARCMKEEYMKWKLAK